MPLPLITSCIYCLDYTSSCHFHPKTLVFHTQWHINMTPQTTCRSEPSNYCSLFEYECIRKMEILPIGFYDSNELSYIISVIVNCFCRNKIANKNLALPERVRTDIFHCVVRRMSNDSCPFQGVRYSSVTSNLNIL